MSELKFEGQVALVTGASRGIGAAIALELAKKGLKVTGGRVGLVSSRGLTGGLKSSMVGWKYSLCTTRARCLATSRLPSMNAP